MIILLSLFCLVAFVTALDSNIPLDVLISQNFDNFNFVPPLERQSSRRSSSAFSKEGKEKRSVSQVSVGAGLPSKGQGGLWWKSIMNLGYAKNVADFQKKLSNCTSVLQSTSLPVEYYLYPMSNVDIENIDYSDLNNGVPDIRVCGSNPTFQTNSAIFFPLLIITTNGTDCCNPYFMDTQFGYGPSTCAGVAPSCSWTSNAFYARNLLEMILTRLPFYAEFSIDGRSAGYVEYDNGGYYSYNVAIYADEKATTGFPANQGFAGAYAMVDTSTLSLGLHSIRIESSFINVEYIITVVCLTVFSITY